MKEVGFYLKIHTVELLVNDKLAERIIHREKIYVNQYKENGKYILNPNKYRRNITTFREFKEVMEAIFRELDITAPCITRIDVSFNTKVEFKTLYKLNLYLFYMLASWAKAKPKDRYMYKGDDLVERSLKFRKSNFELEIYDKNAESQGRDDANTRIEFRYKNKQGLNLEETLERVISDLKSLPQYVNEPNQYVVAILDKKYKEELHALDGNIKNLTAFVMKHSTTFFNCEILKGVYGLNMEGDFDGWKKKFFYRGHNLILYKKSDVRRYITELINATYRYLER